MYYTPESQPVATQSTAVPVASAGMDVEQTVVNVQPAAVAEMSETPMRLRGGVSIMFYTPPSLFI